MSRIQEHELFDLMVRHLNLIKPCGLFVPKHHMWAHMMSDIVMFGSARLWATWRGGGLNKDLKAVAQAAHQLRLERTVLKNMAGSLRRKRKSDY